MSNNIWKEEDEFRDMPDEVNGEEPQGGVPFEPVRARPLVQPIMQPEEVIEAIEQSEEDEDAEIDAARLGARTRIEMGSLYEMVIAQDIFIGMDADPQAVKNVQRELRRFAKERMEVMLGMRAERIVQETSSPFNPLEIDILKKLASAATKGLSARPEAPQIAHAIQAPRKTTITPITSVKKETKLAVPQKKLATKPAAPLERKAQPKQAVQVLDDEEPLSKPLSEMTEQEIIERNARSTARQMARRAQRPANAMPMPSTEQQEMIHTQRAYDLASSSPNVAGLIALMSNKK